MFRRISTALVAAAAAAAPHRSFPPHQTASFSVAALKTLDLTHKYSADEAARILRHLNAADGTPDALHERFDITKGRAQTIRAWRNKNGALGSVAQLLELDGFGVKNVEKLCASILREEAAEAAESSLLDDVERNDVQETTKVR